MGPRVYSKTAKSHLFRLDWSPLEELYKRVGWYTSNKSERYLQKLVTQHRCPKFIAKFPYDNFYKDYRVSWKYASRLKKQSQMDSKSLQGLGIKNKFFPVIFRQFRGQEVRDVDSCSLYNPYEAKELCRIVQTFLLNNKDNPNVSTSDIGIISEQYKQRKYIIELLKKERYTGERKIFVASCTQMQGKEIPYIFISTAVCRGSGDDINGNVNRSIWRNYKKLNTAMTRASKMVYIVGDYYTLNYDETWSKFITYCKNNNSFIENINGIKDMEYMTPAIVDSSPKDSPTQVLTEINNSNFPALSAKSTKKNKPNKNSPNLLAHNPKQEPSVLKYEQTQISSSININPKQSSNVRRNRKPIIISDSKIENTEIPFSPTNSNSKIDNNYHQTRQNTDNPFSQTNHPIQNTLHNTGYGSMFHPSPCSNIRIDVKSTNGEYFLLVTNELTHNTQVLPIGSTNNRLCLSIFKDNIQASSTFL